MRLARQTDWAILEKSHQGLYAEAGQPGSPTRFMAGLHILKHTYALSDEEPLAGGPYFQYITGE